MKRFVFIFVLLAIVALVLVSCDSCEVICCKTVEYWWGSSRPACKTVRSDDCTCPDGWTMTEVLFYPDE